MTRTSYKPAGNSSTAANATSSFGSVLGPPQRCRFWHWCSVWSERRLANAQREEPAVTVFVRYVYPIYAEVDLDEREVIRVVVDDEAPRPEMLVLDADLHEVTVEVRAAAIEIAEDTLWPSWDYGW